MGTRADFYVGRGLEAEWLGSVAWDGYPDSGDFDKLLKTKTEQAFRKEVERILSNRDDATKPKDGWPWPWDNSQTTDYSYAFDEKVWITCFGHGWTAADDWARGEVDDEDEQEELVPKVDFPDMKAIKNVTFGKRSGVMIFRAEKAEN